MTEERNQLDAEPVYALDIKTGFMLDNGMYCVYGRTLDGDPAADVYSNDSFEKLMYKKRGFHLEGDPFSDDNVSEVRGLMNGIVKAFRM